MKDIKIIGLIALNLVLIFLSSFEKGKVGFYTIPTIIVINFITGTIGFILKYKKLGIAALIMFFAAPFFAFLNFIRVFPFLTR